MGAGYVFEPAEFAKGKGGRREPADLIWASNGAVVMMSMKAGKKPLARKSLKALDQLGGGLRSWRNLGEPLRDVHGGDSAREIAFESGTEVVLLSVVSDEDAPVSIHGELARRLEVAVVATVPETLVHTLAEQFGSSRDLIELLLALPVGAQTPVDQAHSTLLAQKQEAWNRSMLPADPASATSAHADFLARNLLAVRQGGLTGLGVKASRIDVAAAMDDLGWSGLYALLGAVFSPAGDQGSLLWVPPKGAAQYAQSLIDLAQFLQHAGAPLVMSTTVSAPSEHIAEAWPPSFSDAVSIVELGRHTFVVGRVHDLDSFVLRERWPSAWRLAIEHRGIGFPPLGLISWQSDMGHGFVFAGSEGLRESETSARLAAARSELSG